MHPMIREKIARGLGIDLQGKADVYAQIYDSAALGSLSYWSEVALSAGIATMGLVQNSPAVIIGAMLISPLMGPILSTGLALAVGDSYLLLKSFLNLSLSMAASVGLAGLLAWLLPFHAVTQEILSRIHPNLLDLGIAILSGLAGSIVVCRGGTGSGVMALPGVAIAVALMPPLCVMGFGVGSSFNREIVYGASLLFLTNLVAIVSSAFAVFLLVGMDASPVTSGAAAPQTSAAKEHLYQGLQNSPLHRLLKLRGSLGWRTLTLLILLAIVFVPLRDALIQVKNEAIARNAVLESIRDLVPPEAVVTQSVRYAPHQVAISIVSARPISADRIENARRLIERRTGGEAIIAVQEVASRSELTSLLEKLTPPPQTAPPPPLNMTSLETQVLGRVQPALDATWPAETPLKSWELGFTPAGPVLHLQYEAKTALEPFSIALVQQTMRTRLEMPQLTVLAERLPAPRQRREARPAEESRR